MCRRWCGNGRYGLWAGLVGCALVLGGWVPVWAQEQGPPPAGTFDGSFRCSRAAQAALPALTVKALHEDASVSSAAIAEMRKFGPLAVQHLLGDVELQKSPRWSSVLDAVAQQKDAKYSGLFWHTDLSTALAEARYSKKPVLSLRLLGQLTDELSCANSRYFRTTLYPNQQVKALLSQEFVLHWQTVRAVPIITIDFGDGRKIQRTITGNSLHLILDDQGRSIDVLPGLYAAEPFVNELRSTSAAARKLAEFQGAEFVSQRARMHATRLQEVSHDWEQRCAVAQTPGLAIGINHPDEVWARVVNVPNAPAVLDETARRAVLEHLAPAERAGRLALAKSIAETPQMAMIRNLSRVISEDSARNEYYFHAQIHSWFSLPVVLPEGDALVARVYADLFLSPLDDPWYGLSRPDIYSAIKQDGRLDAVTQNSGD
ncbi:MAG: hypothetical protein JSS02_26510 [Planctomycetes bacterium]|nr:hypothetical protein [Planctomycetota bacterium]